MDWVQYRTRHIFSSAVGNDATVLAAILSYSTTNTISAGGATPVVAASQVAIQLNPYFTAQRINKGGGTLCGTSRDDYFTNTLFHEARHAYLDAQVAIAGNDKDGDHLPANPMPIAPTIIVQDSTAMRSVCNDLSGAPGTLLSLSFHGDSIWDAWASNGVYAGELDAVTFAAGH